MFINRCANSDYNWKWTVLGAFTIFVIWHMVINVFSLCMWPSLSCLALSSWRISTKVFVKSVSVKSSSSFLCSHLLQKKFARLDFLTIKLLLENRNTCNCNCYWLFGCFWFDSCIQLLVIGSTVEFNYRHHYNLMFWWIFAIGIDGETSFSLPPEK